MRKDTPEAVILQAQELIDRVQRDLADGDAFFHAHGLDRQEFHEYLRYQLTPHEKEQAQKAFQQQVAQIEQEVCEEATRRAFANAPLRGIRRPRLMV